MQILLVEDDERLSAVLREGLLEEGFQVHLARDGAAGLDMASSTEFDAIVLDVTLPRMDGLAIARHLRARSVKTPILMLTARDSIPDEVKGLNAGADDYLTKPFAFEVLLARLRAVSRRGPIPRSILLTVADLKLDTVTRRVTRAAREVHLTPREYSVLELLMTNAGRPLSRSVILEKVWGFDTDIEENTVEAFIKLLRSKVDLPVETKLIHTMRGVGYYIRGPVGKASL